MKKKPPKEIRDHWSRIAELGCIVTGAIPATIHHAHGGSISDRLASLGLFSMSGVGLRGMSDWLVIPLVIDLHSIGPWAIDGGIGVVSWERKFYPQAVLVDEVGERIGYSLWQRHEHWVRSTGRSIIRGRGTVT